MENAFILVVVREAWWIS